MAERAAPVAHDLAVQSLAEVEAVDRRLPHKPQESASADWLGKARAGKSQRGCKAQHKTAHVAPALLYLCHRTHIRD